MLSELEKKYEQELDLRSVLRSENEVKRNQKAEHIKQLHAENPKQKITDIMKQSAADWHKLSKSK